jgi:HD superfamily phosphodiesterase
MQIIVTTESFVKTQMPKEYFCHIQFVQSLTNELTEKYHPKHKLELQIAALLHDIGRTKKIESEHHSITGSKMLPCILKELLLDNKLNTSQIELIQELISSHNNKTGQTLEEKILITADSLSKVKYHSAFMLLCKKETFLERAQWGSKYLNKGFNRIQFEDLKNNFNKQYSAQKFIYEKIMNEK